MTHSNTTALNNRFGLDNRLQFSEGFSGLAKAELCYKEARLELYLQGAHVTRYQPIANHEILWMSDTAVYATGKALRGGIPLCWPWFGPHPENLERPQHGYARTASFTVLSTSANAESTSIILALDPAAAPYPEWQDRAQLEVEIRLSDSLWMEMRTLNSSDTALTVSNALHTYFSISGRNRVTLPGVTGLTYLDKPLRYKQLEQTDAITISGEVDRVYLAPPLEIELLDSVRQTKTSISTWGNHNLVVWNPGGSNAKTMADFDDRGFDKMLCIEPANALDQSIRVNPGECHRLGQKISL
jgi:D-hexose-6-phosphate mutarotase